MRRRPNQDFAGCGPPCPARRRAILIPLLLAALVSVPGLLAPTGRGRALAADRDERRRREEEYEHRKELREKREKRREERARERLEREGAQERRERRAKEFEEKDSTLDLLLKDRNGDGSWRLGDD